MPQYAIWGQGMTKNYPVHRIMVPPLGRAKCANFFGFYGFAKSDLYEMAFSPTNRRLKKFHTLGVGSIPDHLPK